MVPSQSGLIALIYCFGFNRFRRLTPLGRGKTARLIVVVGWDLRETMALHRQTRTFALGVLALGAAAFGCSLAGCSSPIADLPSLGSTDASAKPKEPYLPVHDLPPARDEAVIPPDQRAKIEAELAAARDRQASSSAAQNAGGQNSTAQNAGAK
jgi:hypothetical protein